MEAGLYRGAGAPPGEPGGMGSTRAAGCLADPM